MATIRLKSTEVFGFGTSRNDKIYGSKSPFNMLAGGNGDDAMWGRGGVDVMDGGAGSDKLSGESGDDILAGGRGADILTGGSGKDLFAFDAKLKANEVDTITDFNVKQDGILLDNAFFKKLGKGTFDKPGKLKADFFTTGSAADANDRIVYNKETGALYHDADGNGVKEAVQFAQLKTGLDLTYKDFFII